MARVLNKHLTLIGATSAAPSGWYVSPHGYSLYRTAAGDTFKTLAATYLGDSSRYLEIYNIQSAPWRAGLKNDPSNLPAGSELFMPEEAITKAKSVGQVVGGAGEPDAAIEAQGTITDAQAVSLAGGPPGSVTTLPEVVVTGDLPPKLTTGKIAAVAAGGLGFVALLAFAAKKKGGPGHVEGW